MVERMARGRGEWRPVISLYLLLILWLGLVVLSFASPTSPSSPTVSASVDLVASDEVKYVVGLLRSSAAASPPPSADSSSASSTEPTIVYMTAASGKRFRCSIPHPNAPSTLAAPHPTTTTIASTDADIDSTTGADSPHAAQTASITAGFSSAAPPFEPFMSLGKLSGRLRKRFRTGCFTLAAGWWMYELCPFVAVRQFHTDGTPPAGPDGTRYLNYQISSTFSLGKYDEDGDEWLWQSYSGKSSAPGVGDGEWVYVQYYNGGNEGRAATVRYLCNTSPLVPRTNIQQQQQQQQQQLKTAVADHRLVAVREEATYVYSFDVATPLVCPTTNRIHPTTIKPPTTATTTTTTTAATTTPTQSPTPPPPDYPNAGTELNRALQALYSLMWEECLTYFAGWWTYKFCYLDALNQFHREARQQAAGQAAAAHGQHAADIITTAEYELGHFAYSGGQSAASSYAKGVPAQTASTVSPTEIVMRTSIVKGATWEETYVRQLYSDGTACDVKPGSTRQTEVRFVCDSNGQHQQQQQQQQQQNNGQQQQQQQQQRAQPQKAALVSVSEDSTCHYVAVVTVPALCSHSLFSPELPTVHEIECTEVKDTSR